MQSSNSGRLVRKPYVAGYFYPKDKVQLERMLSEFVKPRPSADIKALIVPHAGYIYSGVVAGKAYSLLPSFKEVVIIGPSHYHYFYGVAECSFSEWETPLGCVASKPISMLKDIAIMSNEVHLKEHSIEVQLPFLQYLNHDFVFYPLLTGVVEHKKIAMELCDVVEDRLLIISSDLSHYHDYETAVKKDRRALDAILSLDVNAFASNEACGKDPIMILLHIALMKGWSPELVDYKNSGDTAGDKQRVVGYGAVAFY